MPNLYTTPSQITVGFKERIPVGIDCTANVAGGDSLSSPSSVCTNKQTGAVVTLTDTPSVTGNIVTQVIRGSDLAPISTVNSGQYRVDVTVTFNATKILTFSFDVYVPY